MSAQLATRCAALMALACVLLAGAAAATDAASPEKICASTTQDERRRLNTTAYVTCEPGGCVGGVIAGGACRVGVN